MADAPFIITTQIDQAGIDIGLRLIAAKLQKFDPKANFKDLFNTKQLTQFDGKVKQLTANVSKLKGQLGGAATSTKKLADNTKKTSNALADVSRRVFVWGSMSALIFGALQNLKDFYTLTIQTNTALAELKKVLPRESDFAALKGAGFELAVEFGADPEDVFQILKRFGQAGLTAEQAIKAAQTALLALNLVY